jgi:hypothetical protein
VLTQFGGSTALPSPRVSAAFISLLLLLVVGEKVKMRHPWMVLMAVVVLLVVVVMFIVFTLIGEP